MVSGEQRGEVTLGFTGVTGFAVCRVRGGVGSSFPNNEGVDANIDAHSRQILVYVVLMYMVGSQNLHPSVEVSRSSPECPAWWFIHSAAVCTVCVCYICAGLK